MRFLAWNASGLLKNGVNQVKADWLLSYLNNHSDIAALAIQETHCQNIDRFCQAIHDISDKYSVVHSFPVDGDEWAGIMIIISKEYEIISQHNIIEGRVLCVRIKSLIYQTEMDVFAVYGYPAGRQPWIHKMGDAIDNLIPTIIMGDFNFVSSPLDRVSNTMNHYDK